MIDKITSLLEKQELWRGKNSINLIPSENIMSPMVRALLSSDFGQRYTARDKFYMGTHFTDEIEQHGEKLAREVFHSQTACLRPLSGHIADLIALASFSRPNDTIMCVAPRDGGYPGIWNKGIPSFMQLENIEFPFLKEAMNINVGKAAELIRKKRPRILVFGASLFLFPHPVRELAKVAHETSAHVCYDGSHVLGLIAGKQFQNPLQEGITLLFGSTHKSFFGPQGGIILADKEHGEVIEKNIFPTFVDNAHWNRIAALAMALAELKEFGREYATQVIKNAQILAKTLAEYDFPVACPSLGFTRSHQIYLEYGSFGSGRKIATTLEKANIIADCGVRLGTCEITRRGMKQKEMLKIAEFIKRAIKDGEQPSRIKPEVTKFMREFREIEYCFK